MKTTDNNDTRALLFLSTFEPLILDIAREASEGYRPDFESAGRIYELATTLGNQRYLTAGIRNDLRTVANRATFILAQGI